MRFNWQMKISASGASEEGGGARSRQRTLLRAEVVRLPHGTPNRQYFASNCRGQHECIRRIISVEEGEARALQQTAVALESILEGLLLRR